MPTPMSTMAVLLTSSGWVWAQTRTKPSRAPLHGVLRTPAKKPMPAEPARPEAAPWSAGDGGRQRQGDDVQHDQSEEDNRQEQDDDGGRDSGRGC